MVVTLNSPLSDYLTRRIHLVSQLVDHFNHFVSAHRRSINWHVALTSYHDWFIISMAFVRAHRLLITRRHSSYRGVLSSGYHSTRQRFVSRYIGVPFVWNRYLWIDRVEYTSVCLCWIITIGFLRIHVKSCIHARLDLRICHRRSFSFDRSPCHSRPSCDNNTPRSVPRARVSRRLLSIV